MNEYIFYTTEGTTCPPNENMEVENCQVLGRAYGKNAIEARSELEKQCNWIKESGFDIEHAMSKQLLTDENKKDIETVIEYLIKDEYKHYLEEGKPQNHIYRTLTRLKELVRK